jgi:glycosyltransferase involved in cell wall biosynthesis
VKLIVHAPNVHRGGGKVLLAALLQAVPSNQEAEALCDERLAGVTPAEHVRLTSYAPSLGGRWAAERRLKSLAGREDVVLCMGNLPPLYALHSRVYLFLQNRYLCEPLPLEGFDLGVRCRIAAERIWLQRRLSNVSRVIVQTRSMRESAQRHLGIDAAVIAFAAGAEAPAGGAPAARPPPKRFLYPASAEPHKNHARLVEAWRLLRASGIEAELHLTVSGQTPLAQELERWKSEGLPLVNHGEVDAARLRELYSSCDALVYPSTAESFGLPLVEARAAGLPIVAAELDYVRDVADPVQTFDAGSSVSIARAVRRYLGAPERPADVISPAAFLERLLEGKV